MTRAVISLLALLLINQFQFAQSSTNSCTSFLVANGLAVNLNGPNTSQQIAASDFDLAGYADCENIAAIAFSTDPTDTERTFDCSHLGNQSIELYVIDNMGNYSSVSTYITVQEQFGFCSSNNGSDCAKTMVVYNGLATALNNQNLATIQGNDLVKRLEENCAGDPTVLFESTAQSERSFNTDNIGIHTVVLQLQLEETLADKVISYVLIQEPLSTDGCIPVPIVYNGAAATLGPSGTIQVDATAFNAASYSDCGGTLTFSFSTDVTDQQRTFDCTMLGFQTIEIWVTDKQTSTQNKVLTYLAIQDNIGACGNNMECPDTYIFTENETVNAEIYQASDYIHFQNIVNFSEQVTLKAGNSISLLPGTHIQANSDFLAKIEDCSTNNLDEIKPTTIAQRQQIVETSVLVDNSLTVAPNPFHTAMAIDYALGVAQEVHLSIYDRYGQLVKTLLAGDWHDAGQHTYSYNNNHLSTGMYFLVLRTKDGNRTRKVVVAR